MWHIIPYLELLLILVTKIVLSFKILLCFPSFVVGGKD